MPDKAQSAVSLCMHANAACRRNTQPTRDGLRKTPAAARTSQPPTGRIAASSRIGFEVCAASGRPVAPCPAPHPGHRRPHRTECHASGPDRTAGRAAPVAPSRRQRHSCRAIMPKRRNHPPAPPPPVQLPLFAETASLVRIRPELNEWRYYRMAVWPDLFGRALLVRQWGRIGTEGRRRFDPHPDPGAAINALAALLRIKRRRGYQDRSE